MFYNCYFWGANISTVGTPIKTINKILRCVLKRSTLERKKRFHCWLCMAMWPSPTVLKLTMGENSTAGSTKRQRATSRTYPII